MSINKLKSIVRRGTIFGATFAMVLATFAPASFTFADSLNPLTERSLTLSSSSPGWENTDGSGNSTYAPPNSGANGQKSGNYFSFKVSTNSDITANGGTNEPIKAITFQYCAASAGLCNSPGNDVAHGTDTASTSDLNVVYPSATEVGSGDFATVIDSTTGLVKAVPGYTNENPKYQFAGGTGDAAEAAKAVTGNYIVMTKAPAASTWTQNTGWTATTSNQEDAATGTTVPTGQQNTIILQNTTGMGLAATTQVKVLFFATAANYITNPGAGAFFVKINTFKTFTPLATATPGPENTLVDNINQPGDVIDGGVTVANVMNQSIQITTKVLETMQFSVGTVDPNTLNDTQLAATALARSTHTPCDVIQTGLTAGDPANVLALGDQSQESSLSTTATYGTHSYWRLSSNSSAGATVYYSGHTLSNTSGDEITPIGVAKKTSTQGAEQFGLAIDSTAITGQPNAFQNAAHAVDYSVDRATGKNYENAADTNDTASITGVDNSLFTDLGATGAPGSYDYTNLNKSYHTPKLDPLTPSANYDSGSGKVNSDGAFSADASASFAFDPLSDTIPTPIANESSQVVDCVTAKMRYIANIAATTPAGIYTTKINYIAAPQY